MRLWVGLVGIAMVSQASAGEVRFSQQGRLLNSVGEPLQGTHDLTIRLYDVESGGSAVWKSEFDQTPFADGFFAVTLTGTGDLGTDLDIVLGSGDGVWMTFQVDTGSELTPRQPMDHVPRAAWAERAGGAGLIDLTTNGTDCTVLGGLGYDGPSESLYVCNGTSWIAAASAAGPSSIVNDGTTRNWADGTFAASCKEYRFPPSGYEYTGPNATSGRYTIQPFSTSYDVYCDMDTDGGGWTMVMRASNSDPGIDLKSNASGWSVTSYGSIDNVSFTDRTDPNDHVSQAFTDVRGHNVLIRERLGTDYLNAVYTDDGALSDVTLRSLMIQSNVVGGRACSGSIVFPDPATPNTAPGASTPYSHLVFSGNENGDNEPAKIAIRSACNGDSQLLQMGYTRSGHGNWEVWSQDNTIWWPDFRSAYVFIR